MPVNFRRLKAKTFRSGHQNLTTLKKNAKNNPKASTVKVEKEEAPNVRKPRKKRERRLRGNAFLPAYLQNIDEELNSTGFAAVTIDAQIAGAKKIWDGTSICCLVCIQGETKFEMDAKPQTLKAGQAMIIDSVFFLANKSVSKDFKAYAIVCTKFFLFSPTFALPLDLHFHILQNPVIGLNKGIAEQFARSFESLLVKMEKIEGAPFLNQDIFDNYIVNQSAKIFCYELYNLYSKKVPLRKKGAKVANREMIVLRFLHLLHQNVHKERYLAFYSERLEITPQYLTTILKLVTGYSANQWMHIMVIERAKYQLLTQYKNIQEVAKDLNYPDQSTFGKMFKTQTGMSPIQFKKEVSNR